MNLHEKNFQTGWRPPMAAKPLKALAACSPCRYLINGDTRPTESSRSEEYAESIYIVTLAPGDM
jgi:hypothetical protein